MPFCFVFLLQPFFYFLLHVSQSFQLFCVEPFTAHLLSKRSSFLINQSPALLTSDKRLCSVVPELHTYLEKRPQRTNSTFAASHFIIITLVANPFNKSSVYHRTFNQTVAFNSDSNKNMRLNISWGCSLVNSLNTMAYIKQLHVFQKIKINKLHKALKT